MKKLLIVTAVLVLAGGAGAWFVLARHSDAPGSGSTANNPTTDSGTSSGPTPGNNIAQALPKVSIQDFAFGPTTLRVQQGTTVTWTNNGSAAHTVTENDGHTGPDSGTLNPGQTYSFTFSNIGTYRYHCTFHPDMTGTIVVFSSAIK